MSLKSISDGIVNEKVVIIIQRVTMIKTTTATTINHSNVNKAPLCCEKQGGLWEHKLLPMESAIKTFGHTHPGSDNNGIQK